MNSFLDQYNENVRAYQARRPQRLLKIVIVTVAVLIVAPCASVIGRQFGPTAAFVAAFAGLMAVLMLWWIASLILFPAPPQQPFVPPQPASPFGSQPVPAAMPAESAPGSSGVAVALVLTAAVLCIFCCGGVAGVAALVGGRKARPAAPAPGRIAQPPAPADPLARMQAEQQQRFEEMTKQREKQIRDMEQRFRGGPGGKR